MERKNKVLIFLVCVSILIIIVSTSNSQLDKKIIPAKFVLGNNMGFDLTPGRLNFGKIVPGYGASRNLKIDNNYNKKIIVNIKSSGEISDSLVVSENNFMLNPFESKNITFSIYTDKLMELGDYDGKIIITSKASS